MRRLTLVFCLLFATVTAQAGDDHLIRLQSPHSVTATADRLEAALKEKGMAVFARINHSAGAQAAGLELAPTEQFVFGNPKIGTPLMNCQRTVAIDLPQKMLIWEDNAGQTWVAYNDPEYIKSRHGVEGCDEVFTKVAGALAAFAKAATTP